MTIKVSLAVRIDSTNFKTVAVGLKLDLAFSESYLVIHWILVHHDHAFGSHEPYLEGREIMVLLRLKKFLSIFFRDITTSVGEAIAIALNI